MGIEALLTSQVIGLDAALTGKLNTSGGTVTGQLTNALGTITASTPFTISQTWNNAAVSFNALSIALTDSASDSLSTSINVSVDSQPRLRHTVKNNRNRLSLFSRYAGFDNELWYAEVGSTGGFGGFVACPGGVMESITTNGNSFYYVSTVASSNYRQWFLQAGSKIKVGQSTTFEWYGADYRADTNTSDLVLARDAAGTLAQRNSTNAQTFRLANTYTSSTSFENLQLQWSSNEARIGTSVGSAGGTQRSLVLGTWDSAGAWTAGLTVETTGNITASRPVTLSIPAGTQNALSMTTTDNATNVVIALKDASSLQERALAFNFLDSSGTAQGQVSYWNNPTAANHYMRFNVTGTEAFRLTNSRATFTQTWNNVATTFTGILANVTDTASASGSLLLDLQVGGTSKFKVDKAGTMTAAAQITGVGGTLATGLYTSGRLTFAGTHAQLVSGGSALQFALSTGSGIVFAESSLYPVASFGGSFADNAIDIGLRPEIAGGSRFRDAYFAGTVSASKLYTYNTYTSSTSYERGKIAWESNVLKIGTEKGSAGGSARALELQTDGTTRLTVESTGTARFSGLVICTGTNGLQFSNTGNQYGIFWQASTTFRNRSDGVFTVSNYAENDFGRLQLGGATSSFPAIKRNSAAINFRLADDSADADITAKAATFSGNVTVSAVNLVTDTTTGTKIGTGTTQKIGFYDKTPVVQPTAVADATDAASVITQLNALLSRMRDLGLIAT